MKITKTNNRNKNGFIVIATYLGFLFLLPLGLYAFEVLRIQLCQHQLLAITDAAALAGSSYLSDPSTQEIEPATALKNAKQQALMFIQRNIAASYELTNTELSDTVDTDTPKKGVSKCDILYDAERKIVTAKAALGVEPAFGRFLGITTVPVRAQSHAGVERLDGDVVIVFDMSRSMGFATKSVWAIREWNSVDNKFEYKIKKELTTDSAADQTLPAFPNYRPDVLPNPELVDFSRSEKMKALASAPGEVKLAALYEAKMGNLESKEIFNSSKAANSDLMKYITPAKGFQDDYQKLALDATQPLADAKSAVTDFVAETSQTKTIHTALITFSGGVSRGPASTQQQDVYDSYSTRTNFRLPNIELNKSEPKQGDVIKAIAPSPCFMETNTGDALRAAMDMLKGDGHRKSVAKSIIILTDGKPNPPRGNYETGLTDAVNVATEAGKNGIRIYGVGFFPSYYAQDEIENGPKALNKIVAAAGKGSRVFNAPDIPTLRNILHSLGSSGLPSLVDI
ncbi:MAG: VWA domain-containing protein [Candidatus Obscuribacterales bacterium]|jgi:hypothetical protein|nr:VWA domain-containing protein [Candidatus Obscuribacterales bacterium]